MVKSVLTLADAAVHVKHIKNVFYLWLLSRFGVLFS